MNCISRQMEYRADFVGAFVVESAFQASTIIFFEVIYSHVSDLGGWSRGDVFVFLGSVLLIDAMMMVTYFKNVVGLPALINRGELDFYLLKPIDVQWFASIRYFALPNILQVFTSIGILITGLVMSGWSFSLLPFLLYLALMVNGYLLIYATWMSFQSIAFWMQAAQGFEAAYFMFSHFYLKPDVIYKGLMRTLLIFVMPAIVIASFPVRVLLEKELSGWMILWAFSITTIFMVISRLVFKAGLKRYESASS